MDMLKDDDDLDDLDNYDSAPGWEAIDAALAPIYGDQEPSHAAPAIPGALGGAGPVDGISGYWRDDPQPHWHFITYGFTELYAKTGSNPDISVFGFELTFRLAAPERTERPPMWPMIFLISA